MRRALLLLPVLLVIAVIVLLRGIDDRPHTSGLSSVADATGSASVEAAETSSTEPHSGQRPRVRVAPPPDPANAQTTDAEGDDLPDVRGRVVAADGRPLAGAFVRAEMSLETDFDVEIASPPLGTETLTDAHGRFVVSAWGTRLTIEVHVPLDDSDRAVLEFRNVRGGDEIVFVVPALRTIDVTLATRGGGAVPDTVVDVTTPERLLPDGTRVRGGTQRKRTSGRNGPDQVEGHFRVLIVDGLEPSFSLPDHPTLTLADFRPPPEGAHEIVLVATEGASIEGVCIDQYDEPVDGATICAMAQDAGPEHARLAVAHADGRFRVTGLSRGVHYRLQARQEGYFAEKVGRLVGAGSTDARVELVNAAR